MGKLAKSSGLGPEVMEVRVLSPVFFQSLRFLISYDMCENKEQLEEQLGTISIRFRNLLEELELKEKELYVLGKRKCEVERKLRDVRSR